MLIGSLAAFVQWLVGLGGELQGLHRELQANTERRRRVLSLFFVGGELLREPALYAKLKPQWLEHAIAALPAILSPQPHCQS